MTTSPVDLEALSHLLVEFYERLSSWEQEVARESGLSLPQMHTLEILGHHAPLRMKDLAERLGVTTGTMTVTVDKLERLGLVTRQPHGTDRRSFLVALTPEGERLYQEHHGHHLRLTQELTADLTETELACLTQTLAKMRAVI
ncbi:MAG: transcriptional regulator, MarR family [Desulfomicrobiaceae bacterium]|nr:MarR family transcriptional regulator [Desulfomicrobiaceae bacterium]MBZ4648712.1 transcriptional regulator, MarR family [Desulfomicrobiaceae bacterium]MBZ4685237.1 transcriptional regulator, MarR family [Desulfomicrobiaceae bacterium]MDI3492577.1 hypothetical protein [Desulfomicrobiaceae bacterium]MDK2873371.1 hypothetical protein [Desulfomicrobiaceae bacterium]